VFCVLPGMSITRKYYYAYPENSPNLKYVEKTIAAAKKVINT